MEWKPETSPPAEPKFRAPHDNVLLSTIPHFFALLFIAGCQRGPLPGLYLAYAVIVGTSSLLSLVWHAQRERKNVWFWLDYTFALAWTVMDVLVAVATAPLHILLTVIFLNLVVLGTNQVADHLARKDFVQYEVGHSAWHLLSCAKSVFVAYLLGCRFGATCDPMISQN